MTENGRERFTFYEILYALCEILRERERERERTEREEREKIPDLSAYSTS